MAQAEPAIAIQRVNDFYIRPGPRIILVPQTDESRASVSEPDEPDVTAIVDPKTPSTPKHVTPKPRVEDVPKPKPQRRADAPPPPPPGPPRSVLSAPPPPPGDPTSIRQAPGFGGTANGDKFASPLDPVAAANPPSDPRAATDDQTAVPPAPEQRENAGDTK